MRAYRVLEIVGHPAVAKRRVVWEGSDPAQYTGDLGGVLNDEDETLRELVLEVDAHNNPRDRNWQPASRVYSYEPGWTWENGRDAVMIHRADLGGFAVVTFKADGAVEEIVWLKKPANDLPYHTHATRATGARACYRASLRVDA